MVWRKEGDTWDESDSDEEDPLSFTVVSMLGAASMYRVRVVLPIYQTCHHGYINILGHIMFLPLCDT